MPKPIRKSGNPDAHWRFHEIVRPGVLRVAPMIAIPALLREAGVDPDELLAEFGLPSSLFEDPDNVIRFTTMGRVLSRCVQSTRCEHFGLLLGKQWGASVLGPVGYLIQSAPDVRTALTELATYLHVHDGGAVITLDTDEHTASLGYEIVAPGVERAEQILDAAMAIACNILRALCGGAWRPLDVSLAHARMGRVDPFRDFFKVAPTFNAERTAIVFARGWLDRPLVSADPILHAMMSERVLGLQAATRDDLVGQLRRLLRAEIGSRETSLATVAQRIGMHGRTLNRHLAAEGTSFREVRDTLRWEIACQLLENTRRPACEIAESLGYADAASFNRSFVRRSGMTPGRWRLSGARTHAPLQAEDEAGKVVIA